MGTISLPTELLTEILQNVSRSELVYSVRFVSREWNVVAAEIYFKEVIIHEKNLTSLKELLKVGNVRHSSYVKSLSINLPENLGFENQELEALLEQMPKLTKIDFGKTRFYRRYMQSLVKMKNELKLLKNLSQIVITSNPTIAQHHSSADLYLSTCSAFKENLVRLDLNIGYAGHYPKAEIFEILADFLKLKHLNIYNCLKEQNLSVYDVLEKFPKVESLCFDSQFRVDNTEGEELAKKRMTQPSSVLYPALKNFSLHLPKFSPMDMDFIIYYTAPDLNTLCLQLYQKFSIFEWTQQQGKEVMIKLCQRMNTCNSASIKCGPHPKEPENEQPNQDYFATYLELMQAMVGDQKLSNYENYHNVVVFDSVSVVDEIRVTGRLLSLTHRIDEEVFNETTAPVLMNLLRASILPSSLNLGIKCALKWDGKVRLPLDYLEYILQNYQQTPYLWFNAVNCDKHPFFQLETSHPYNDNSSEKNRVTVAYHLSKAPKQANLHRKIRIVETICYLSEVINLALKYLEGIETIILGFTWGGAFITGQEDSRTIKLEDNYTVDVSGFSALTCFEMDLGQAYISNKGTFFFGIIFETDNTVKEDLYYEFKHGLRSDDCPSIMEVSKKKIPRKKRLIKIILPNNKIIHTIKIIYRREHTLLTATRRKELPSIQNDKEQQQEQDWFGNFNLL